MSTDLIDRIREIGARIPKQKELIQNEEATKTAFVLPFLSALGYNVFDPAEVVPEFTADVGTKKGEKVDYAIMMDGKPVMLVECKWCGTDLDQAEMSQLFRYFAVVEARIGILTNGVIYRFYTDLEEPNKMDKKPFFEVNLLDVQEQSVAELKKLSRSSFNLQEVLSAACDLKYTREIKRILADEMAQPSDDFARFFAERIHSGRITQNVKAQFVEITKKAFRSFLNDQITERLKSAMATPEPPSGEQVAQDTVEPEPEPVPEPRVVTTPEELEAYYLVKSILRNVVDPSRISYRDYVNAFSVLLDGNKRKIVVQFVFSERGKQIRFLTEDRTDYEKVPIEDLDDIYKHSERIIAETRKYENK